MFNRPMFLVFTALLLATSMFSVFSKSGLAAGHQDVTVLEAKTMIETNRSLVILDVRNQSEYVTGHIRNAELIPLFQLNASLNQLNPSDEILVYCLAGGRSATASQILASEGFLHVYNMLGGITEWTREQYPTFVNYASVQEAINSATDGDTIYVGSGIYYEHLSVNKSLALVGENRDTTILDGTANGTILYVEVDNVSISDFKIQFCGCACAGRCGIDVKDNLQNVNVTGNHIFSDGYGIRVNASQNIVITHNNITYSGENCIVIHDSTEILVKDNNIADDMYGVDVTNSTQVTFINNNVTNIVNGIALTNSDNNTIVGNTVASNAMYGLDILQSNSNKIVHNNFKANNRQVSTRNSTNIWDNGLEGNYWSNYTGTDSNNDGIGDTPHAIDSMNIDNHPLTGTFYSFHAEAELDVNIISDSTVDSMQYLAPNCIELQVSNTTAIQTTGFCRISIPHALIDPNNGTIQVVIDNGQTQVLSLNTTLYDDGTYRWIILTYPHSTHEIIIVPESPLLLILPLIITAIAFTAANQRRRSSRTSRDSCAHQAAPAGTYEEPRSMR